MTLTDLLLFSAQLYSAVLAADIAVGLAHAAMDRHGDPACRIRFLGEIFSNNYLHHAYPKAILRHGWIHNLTETGVIATGLIVAFWSLGLLHWTTWVFALVVAASGVVHRWHHIEPDDLCLPIRALYSLGLVQARQQHMEHHHQHDVNYTVVTNLANWILERTRVVFLVDRLVRALTGKLSADLASISSDLRRLHGPAFKAR